ncbi:uncharacterized protein LOC142020371 [Carettochelys insculpta]|uniref:uncharacterized protein LOC142020371 n=1 Tax=Carettochelys insculpta TaxID=44489 RepID=UPI003EB9B284
MRFLALSLLACAAGAGPGPGAPSCPRACRCSPAQTIRCDRAGLSAPPAALAASAVSLSLSDNLLRTLSGSALRNLTLLRSLRLERNRLTFLYPGAFRALGSLRELALGGNPGLRALHAHTFRGLARLLRLDLSACGLFQAHPALFAPLRALEALDLASNRLRHVPPACRSLARLRSLSLQGNRIEALGRDSLKGLPALGELDLRRNRIRAIQGEAFAALPRLAVLRLGHNLLAALPERVFQGLARLRVLHLEANRLAAVGCSLRSLPSLRQLYLNNNRLARVSGAAFSRCGELRFLHLSKNQLRSLPERLLAALPRLRRLVLAHNPWACDCSTRWLRAWRAAHPGVAEGAECAFPAPRNRTAPGLPAAAGSRGCPALPGPDTCEEAGASAAAEPPAACPPLLWAALVWCAWACGRGAEPPTGTRPGDAPSAPCGTRTHPRRPGRRTPSAAACPGGGGE